VSYAIHAVAAARATFGFGLLLLGWRERTRTDITDELAALLTMFAGVLFGVLWAILDFTRDWVAYSDLQRSNAETMTEFLSNDIAAVLAALLAVSVYWRLRSARREALASSAAWLFDGPSRVLDRHGLAMTTIGMGLIAATVLTLWFAGRPVPGVSIP
jgi:hypothetical protein